MLIAAVDVCPQKAAEALCDQHLQKLILETAQVLDAGTEHAAKIVGRKSRSVIKRPGSQYNNPVCVLSKLPTTWSWNLLHLRALLREFQYRRGHRHAYEASGIPDALLHARSSFENIEFFVEHVFNRSDKVLIHVTDGSKNAYVLPFAVPLMRDLFVKTKWRFETKRSLQYARWTGRYPPDWMVEGSKSHGRAIVNAGRSVHSYELRQETS